jgi:hypothetical protein
MGIQEIVSILPVIRSEYDLIISAERNHYLTIKRIDFRSQGSGGRSDMFTVRALLRALGMGAEGSTWRPPPLV